MEESFSYFWVYFIYSISSFLFFIFSFSLSNNLFYLFIFISFSLFWQHLLHCRIYFSASYWNVNGQMKRSHIFNHRLKFGLELFLEILRRWEQSKLRSSAQKTIWSKVVLLTPKIRIIVGFLTEISLVFNENLRNFTKHAILHLLFP